MAIVWIDRMAVDTRGEGDAVVFVHGLGGTMNAWTPLLPALARWRCVRVELPGAGSVSRPADTPCMRTPTDPSSPCRCVGGRPRRLLDRATSAIRQTSSQRSPATVTASFGVSSDAAVCSRSSGQAALRRMAPMPSSPRATRPSENGAGTGAGAPMPKVTVLPLRAGATACTGSRRRASATARSASPSLEPGPGSLTTATCSAR
jgi:pimeloyl-ACP methyl ester carboxylesterase